jgi:hypothetical protein
MSAATGHYLRHRLSHVGEDMRRGRLAPPLRWERA